MELVDFNDTLGADIDREENKAKRVAIFDVPFRKKSPNF